MASLKSIISSTTVKTTSGTDILIHAIIEDLLDSTMLEIYRHHFEEQSIDFLVDCTHQALVKLLSIAYYYHGPTTDVVDWSLDEPATPSPPDSWAVKQIPIRPNAAKSDKETDPAVVLIYNNDHINATNSDSNNSSVCSEKLHSNTSYTVDTNNNQTKLPQIVLPATKSDKKKKVRSTTAVESLPPIIMK